MKQGAPGLAPFETWETNDTVAIHQSIPALIIANRLVVFGYVVMPEHFHLFD